LRTLGELLAGPDGTCLNRVLQVFGELKIQRRTLSSRRAFTLMARGIGLTLNGQTRSRGRRRE